MKIFICFLLFFLSSFFAHAKKIAILIGVGKYASGTGWRSLSSENDVITIKTFLLKQGFVDKNIIMLINGEASQEGIFKAINILTRLTQKGDIIYFHFSGHGQQLFDDNGDETDGLDESIVPYDAPIRFKPGQHEKHIRDDYLQNIFKQLKKIIGNSGQLIVCIDACHSGTGTRDISFDKPITRGTNVIYGESSGNTVAFKSENSFGLEDNDKSSASEICFFGSGPQELNYQYTINGKDIGSLSYAMSVAFERTDSFTTFRNVFDMVKSLMAVIAPLQTPQAEGNLDITIFNGKAVKSKRYFLVTGILKNNLVKINGGLLNGFTEGVAVKFISRQQAGDSILANGIIEKVDIAESIVKLQKNILDSLILFARVYIKKKNPYDINILIDNEILNAYPAFIKRLKREENIHFSKTDQQVYLKKSLDKKYLLLLNKAGFELWKNEITNEIDQEKLITRIQYAARALYYKSITYMEKDLEIEAFLVRVEKTSEGFVVADSIIETENNKQTALILENSYFKIKLTNKGVSKAYYSILDIQPDDYFNIIVPQQEEASSYSIEPMQTIFVGQNSTEPFQVAPPYGLECIKIIASTIPLDFSLQNTRSANQSIQNMETTETIVNQQNNTNIKRAKAIAAYTKTIFFIIGKN